MGGKEGLLSAKDILLFVDSHNEFNRRQMNDILFRESGPKFFLWNDSSKGDPNKMPYPIFWEKWRAGSRKILKFKSNAYFRKDSTTWDATFRLPIYLPLQNGGKICQA